MSDLETLVEDWFSMTEEERRFVLRADFCRGAKYGCEPHFDIEGQWFNKNPERMGFIKCVGSYKWTVTDDFLALKEYLMINRG